MSIEVSMNGSGTIGPIRPGWSVSEYATPVTIGESAGGTGQVSINAKANDDTLFIVNNAVTTTEQSLGSISGIIKSVNESGINASFNHNTQLSDFDVNLNIPALGAGGVVPAIDMCSQLTGRDIILNQNTGYYYSLRGHSQGFDSTGLLAESKTWNNKVYDWTPGIGWIYYTAQNGAVSGSDFFIYNNDIWAGKVYGDYFEDELIKTSSRVSFKAILDESILGFNLLSTLSYVDNDNEGAFVLNVKINPVLENITITGKVIIGGATTMLSSSVSIAGLDLTKELSVFTEFKRPSSASGTHTFTIIACNTSNYNVSYSTGVTYSSARAYGSYWNIANVNDLANVSGVRGLYRVEDSGLPATGFATVATNYILNPSFTIDTNNWDTYGFDSVTKSIATGGWVATNCMKITQTPSPLAWPTYGVQQRFNATFTYPSKINHVSAYVKCTTTISPIKIYVEQYNSSDTLISTTFNDLYDTTSTQYSIGDWRRVFKDFSLVPGVEYILVKFVSDASEYYIDAVMLTNSSSTGVSFSPEYFDGDTTDNATFTYTYDGDGYSVQQAALSAINQEYENPKTYSYNSLSIGSPVSSVISNGWQYIQDACSAFSEEIALVDNNIIIQPISSNLISLDNVVGSPSIVSSIIFGGRNVEIIYSNSSNVYDDSFYDAHKDSNRVLSVKANEVIETTVTLNGTPSIIHQPKRIVSAPVGNMPIGTYFISSSASGYPVVPENQWEDYGGSIEITISKTVPNAVDIVLTGPREDIPSNPGPYKLAYTSGGTDYAALNISGSGVLLNNKTLKLQTGADPLKVANDVSKTINNPFIDTLERAYDRGIWAASIASGPSITLSGTIPVSAIQYFGITQGSLINYRDSIYRIVDCTINNIGVSFNAVRHVTVGDFDSVWAGYLVNNFDLLWSQYQTSDNVIRPLWYKYIQLALILALDTDGNPYQSTSGTATISAFPDTDMNPYYETGGNLPGADPVYLDTDNVPYDGGSGYGS